MRCPLGSLRTKSLAELQKSPAGTTYRCTGTLRRRVGLRALPALVVLFPALTTLQACSTLLSLDEFDEATDGGAQADGPDGTNPPLVFNIILRQTFQECVACGIWFDWQGEQENKAKFVVQFESLGGVHENIYQHGLNGMDNAFAYFLGAANDQFKHSIIVKQAPQYTGLFRADISDIPPDATITKATLYLHINTIEGLADADNSSVLSVNECEKNWDWDHASWTQYDEGATWTQPGGDFGVFVREIRAKEDIRDRGFSRANPNVGFDFTPYVVQLQAARSQT